MIIEKLGLSVWITHSDGTVLPEYQVHATSDDAIQSWVPSTEGETFEICYEIRKNPHPEYDIITLPSLDGVGMRSQVVSIQRLDGVYTSRHYRQLTGSTTARLYKFGRHELTDDDTYAQSDNPLSKDLNTIKLVFEWGRMSGPIPLQCDAPKEIGPIHEKTAKKGHSGAAKLGETISIPIVSNAFDFTIREEINAVTFVFHYAPLDWLQARDIIRRSPQPELLGVRVPKKRACSTPEIIDVDELETDDEIQVVKHMVPASGNSNKKQRTSIKEDVKTTTPEKKDD